MREKSHHTCEIATQKEHTGDKQKSGEKTNHFCLMLRRALARRTALAKGACRHLRDVGVLEEPTVS